MEIKSGYSNLPGYYKIFFHIMVWGVPIIGVGVFIGLLLFVDVGEIVLLLMPLIIAIVSPIVVGKDLIDTKSLKKEGTSIAFSKRFGKPVALDLGDIIDVTVFKEKNRTVALLLSKDQKKVIALGDWFANDDISKLVVELEKDSKKHDFEISRFTNKMALQDHVKTMYS